MMGVISSSYLTGQYSVSPGFAWWYASVSGVDQNKPSREAERTAEKARTKKDESAQKVIGSQSIDLYV